MDYRRDSIISALVMIFVTITVLGIVCITGCSSEVKNTQKPVENMANATASVTAEPTSEADTEPTINRDGYYIKDNGVDAYHIWENGTRIQHYGLINGEWVQAKTYIPPEEFNKIKEECEFCGTELTDLPK